MKTFYDDILEAVSGNREIVEKYIEPSHRFIFSPTFNDEVDAGFLDEVVDLPYPAIHIEMEGNHNITVPRPEDTDKVYVHTLFVKEVGPKDYVFLMYGSRHRNEEVEFAFLEISKDRSPDAWSGLNAVLDRFLNRLKKDKIGMATSSQKIKVGTGKEKRFIKLPKTVYVSQKNKEAEKLFVGRSIDWSHRWEVRGHWRKVAGKGKNRVGIEIEGYTWIKNYTKGPEEAPVIKKDYKVL